MAAALQAGSLGVDVAAAGVLDRAAAAGAGPSPASGAASAAGRELAEGIRQAVAADDGKVADAPFLIPPMPVRPVPDDDDDALVRRAVEGGPRQPR
eukprot:13464134-Alexandrium_andersonii.AAC.1